MASPTDKKKSARKASSRSSSAKKAPGKAKKAAKKTSKKAAGVKAAAKKAQKKKAPVKKAAKKTAAKKAAAKKAAAKKPAKKKAAPKKAARKTLPRKKAAAAKKPARKKAAAKPAPVVAAEPAPDVVVVHPHSTIDGAEPHVAATPGALIAVHSAKYEVTPPDRIVEPVYPDELLTQLSAEYDETHLTLMVRDPQWIFLYWEISRADREMLGLAPEGFIDSLVVRLHDVTGVEDFNGLNATRWYEIPITGGAISWYVNLPDVDREWCAELGILNEQGEFIQICRSNKVRTPRNFIVEEMDAEWMTVSEELRQIIAHSADVTVSGSAQMGSEKAIRQISRRLRLALESREGASAMLSGSLRVRPFRVKIKGEGERGLPLSVRTELIVSGSTDPQATLTVAGDAIDLRPDGSFTLRFELPDGEQVIPVRAESPDGEIAQEITPVVHKETR